MPADDMITCTIHPKGGSVSVTLRANNTLSAGSQFAVWQSDGETHRETWKMSAGANGQATYIIVASADTLDKNYVSWSIAVCSVLPAVDAGIVEIQVFQDNVSCKLSESLRWALTEVPQCDAPGNNVQQIAGSFQFTNA